MWFFESSFWGIIDGVTKRDAICGEMLNDNHDNDNHDNDNHDEARMTMSEGLIYGCNV